jgi:hypothetical protein
MRWRADYWEQQTCIWSQHRLVLRCVRSRCRDEDSGSMASARGLRSERGMWSCSCDISCFGKVCDSIEDLIWMFDDMSQRDECMDDMMDVK